MTKRLLSLALSLMMVLSLFAGLAVPASADGEIGQLFDRYLTGEKIDELFAGDAVKTKSNYVGKNNPGAVRYEIYRVDPEKVKSLQADTSVLEQNALFQQLRERYPDFDVNGDQLLTDLNFNLQDDQEYYALKLYGINDGVMEDYSLTKKAPWVGTVVLDDGTEVDKMDEKIIAIYVEGKNTKLSHAGVTNIGERAFFGMDGVMLAYLGETVKTIGEKAFETCDQLTAVNFPSKLESIGRRAFYACDYLTFARMNTCTLLKEIPERAFCTCSHLTEISFPPNVTSIGDFAFAWDHVLGTNKFNLPANLKTLGTGAFALCSHLGVVGDVSIPASTTNIGAWAFACCFDMGRGGELNIYPGRAGAAQALTIGTGAFAGCASLNQITFPNRVRQIGNYAFAACDQLERVIFGDRDGTDALHVAIIGDRAFDSLEDTGLSAFRTVADAFKVTDSGEAAYVDGSRSAAEKLSGEVYDLSGVTPLKYAAFGSIPPTKDSVTEAKALKHSFPRDVTIWYPSPDYNKDAYGQWRSVVTPGNPMSTWYGYSCEPMWVGHYHEYGDPEIVERTCTQDGLEIYTCHVWQDGKECGHVETVVTAEHTGHDSEVIKSEDPDCTHDGVAWYQCYNEWCDKPIYSETLPALGHDYEHLAEYKAPTCLEPGYARGTCSRCGEAIDEVIPAKGHNTSSMDLVKAPTCTESGYYQGDCMDCGRRNVRQTVPALGHDWNDGVIIKPATQTEDGSALYTCMRCGETEERVIPKTMHVHSYVETVVPPTCTTEGYTNYKCSGCGDEYNDNYIPAAHKWDQGTVVTPAGAHTAGSIKYTCTVCGTYKYDTIPATGLQFVDVPDGDWFTEPVNWAVNHKPQITNGTDPTHFSPDAYCTRGQAVTFLYRAAGEPAVTGVNPFYDVHADDYYYNAVRWAVKNGITDGTSPSTFSPDDTCTRAHIVTFLWRWMNKPGVHSSVIPFWDVGYNEWYTQPVLWAAENNVTNGISPGIFGTMNYCTRAQIVTFLQRADKLK